MQPIYRFKRIDFRIPRLGLTHIDQAFSLINIAGWPSSACHRHEERDFAIFAASALIDHQAPVPFAMEEKNEPPSTLAEGHSASGSIYDEKQDQPSEVAVFGQDEKPKDELSVNGAVEVSADSHEAEHIEYIEGMRLFAVMAAVTLMCFLMLLDVSIIVTVSRPCGVKPRFARWDVLQL